MIQLSSKQFIPSNYQQAIFNAVESGAKAIVVAAVPGSGKTTTIKELIRYIPSSATVLSLAFNSDAAKQLGEKISTMSSNLALEGLQVPLVDSRTIHSLGNATLASARLKSTVKNTKYLNICRQYLESRNIPYREVPPQLSKLVDMVRLTLSGTNEKSLISLCTRFEIDLDPSDDEVWPVVIDGVDEILEAGIIQCQQEKVIDYTDMIWLPTALNLQPKVYDFVLVDEAQDLSPAQCALVLKARKPNGSFIAVGDRNQAIYGFAGASLTSIDEIVKATSAIELPLSICYRCPKSVVAKAASIYPGIEASDVAEEGTVETVTQDKVESLVQAGDLILCRLTAPLVEMCLSLLRSGKRATVRGKDLGSTFSALLEKIQKFAGRKFTFEDLTAHARDYQHKQVQLLSKNLDENEMKISSLEDKSNTLVALHSSYIERYEDIATYDGFLSYITDFFKEDKSAQIVLSTGHRAKGLEYKRVYILQSDKLPHPKAKTPEALTQEHNIMYVMYTRAMEALYLVKEAIIEEVIVNTLAQSNPEKIESLMKESYTQNSEEAHQETPVEVTCVQNTGQKHAGGRPAKDWNRINIKLSPENEGCTAKEVFGGPKRSELINIFLDAYRGDSELVLSPEQLAIIERLLK